MAELVREKALHLTREEVPHALMVEVEELGEKVVRATIFVETESQKQILVGKGGAMVREIGTRARPEVEALLGHSVFLELHVKVKPALAPRRADARAAGPLVPEPIPDRIRGAVSMLAVRPGQRLLELGCGAGLAVDAVCGELGHGTIAAVDRSDSQIDQALRRNAGHVGAGRASFAVAAAHELPFAAAEFDTVFAVRVDLFWTRDATPELEEVERVLRPGGSLRLFNDSPAPETGEAIAARVAEALYGRERLTRVRVDRAPVLCVSSIRR